MDSFNIKKFQNTPRAKDGRAAVGANRARLPSSAFEVAPFRGRGAFLHPTKGWRQRNLVRMARHGEIVQHLDMLRRVAIDMMLIAREERKKQRPVNAA